MTTPTTNMTLEIPPTEPMRALTMSLIPTLWVKNLRGLRVLSILRTLSA